MSPSYLPLQQPCERCGITGQSLRATVRTSPNVGNLVDELRMLIEQGRRLRDVDTDAIISAWASSVSDEARQ